VPDTRPYELIWANRREEVEPLVDFERTLGWSVEPFDGADGSFERSQDQQLWGEYTGLLRYSGTQASSRLILRPPEGIEIRERFDSLEMWIYGPETGEASRVTPPVIRVHVQDADGRLHAVELARVDWEGWWLAHRSQVFDTESQWPYPCLLTGIEVVTGKSNDGRMAFDSLAIHNEVMRPLGLGVRPRVNLPTAAEQQAGVHIGSERLDFPVSESSLWPPAASAPGRNSLVSTAGVFRFEFMGEGGGVTFTVNPSAGVGGLEVRRGDRSCGFPLRGAGVAGHPLHQQTPVLARVEDGGLVLGYEDDCRLVYRMRGRTLAVEFSSPAHQTGELQVGMWSGVRGIRAVPVPGFHFGEDSRPRIAVLPTGTNGADAAWFASVLLDPYRSNASEWFSVEQDGEDLVAVNGGARYRPLTDGGANPLWERVYVTLAPRVEDVLPSVPNPVGAHAAEAAGRSWAAVETEVDYDQEAGLAASRARRGLVRILQCANESVWRGEYESYALRTRPDPLKGGETALSELVRSQQRLGWRFGLYANYAVVSPLSQHWSRDWVARDGDGQWQSAGPRQYVIKAPASAEFQSRLAPVVHRRFAPDASFVDGHTRQPPWTFTDYDARVAGAGTFSQVLLSYGEILRNESLAQGGPAVAAEGCQWLFAGLSDGHLGAAADPLMRAGQPYFPVFLLSQVHSREVGFGMGSFREFFQGDDRWRSDPVAAVDQYLAAQIGYGRNGRLCDAELGNLLACRSYYLMDQLQSHYALLAPARMAYHDGERLISVSEMLAASRPPLNRLYTAYPSGLETWVNGDHDRDWIVRLGRETWTLPPFGWLAVAPTFLESSCTHHGARMDSVSSEAYSYHDGRGSEAPLMGLACKGPLVWRQLSPDSYEALDLDGAGRFGISPTRLGGRVIGDVSVTDEFGEEAGPAFRRESEGLEWIRGSAGAFRYLIQVAPLAED